METNPPTDSKSPLRIVTLIARILFGLVFLVFGLNGFLHFIPQPKDAMSEAAMAVVGGFMKSGYMFPLISGTQVIVGVLLLTNCFVPLALALIAPEIVNILAFHVFLEQKGLIIAIVVTALEVYLAWAYRKAYYPMLALRVRPS